MIKEPIKIDKTCTIGHDIPESSVGPRSIRKGHRQPPRSFGLARCWVGLLVCCLAHAPASATAIEMLTVTSNDCCSLVALNLSPQGSLLRHLSHDATAVASTAELEGRVGGYASAMAGNATCLQKDMGGCTCLSFRVGIPN